MAKYCRERQLSPKLFDSKSFRTISLGKKGKKGVIGCPKKQYSGGKCKVGTRLQTILHPEGSERCPIGTGGRELKKRRKNPSSMYGYYVMTYGGGQYQSIGWYATRKEAEEELRRIMLRGSWEGMPPKIEPAYRVGVTRYRDNPGKVISHKKALQLTQRIIRYARKLYKHEQHGVRYENPGEMYHRKKFAKYMEELEKYPIGSINYVTTLAQAYEHLRSAEQSLY
jgi:hypothetical protein